MIFITDAGIALHDHICPRTDSFQIHHMMSNPFTPAGALTWTGCYCKKFPILMRLLGYDMREIFHSMYKILSINP